MYFSGRCAYFLNLPTISHCRQYVVQHKDAPDQGESRSGLKMYVCILVREGVVLEYCLRNC